MKTKLLTAIILLFAAYTLPAQDYIPTAVEGAHWIVNLDITDTPQPIDGLWEYYATGDTVIDIYTYKKILYRPLVVTQDGPPFHAEEPYELFGFLRDDIQERKVYAISLFETSMEQCPINEEYMLFDFSLQIGDTANLCIVPSFIDVIINEKYPSDILGFNTIVYSGGEYQFYEGMGSNHGLFESLFSPFKKASEKSISDTYLYYYCRQSPCSILVSSPEQYVTFGIKVSPVPADDYFIFEINPDDFYSQNNRYTHQVLSIRDIFGHQVIKTEIKDSKTRINTRELKQGIYSYSIDNGSIFQTGKVVISR
jgi:hypothetical protein